MFIVFNRLCRTASQSHLQRSVKMGLIGRPATSVNSYQLSLRDYPEERMLRMNCSGSLKSRYIYMSLQDVGIATYFYTGLQHSETEHKINYTYTGSNLNQLSNRKRGTCSGALARGIAVQAGRSLFRFPMVSLGFFI